MILLCSTSPKCHCYSVLCNCLFANFCTYLDDQLRWAFCFSCI